MADCAPRISPRLLAAIERLDDGTMPFAELCRRVGAAAEALELQRPSYESVRVLARRNRRLRRANPTAGDVLRDVLLAERDALDLLRHGAQLLPPPPYRP